MPNAACDFLTRTKLYQVRLGLAMVQDRHFGSGCSSKLNRTVAKMVVWGINQPELLTEIWFNSTLPPGLIWAGCQHVAQRVHPLIQKRLLFLEIVNSRLSKSDLQQPMGCFCKHCHLQYRLNWNCCFPFDILTFCQSGRSIIPFWTQQSTRCCDSHLFNNLNCGHSLNPHFQDEAESMSLLFLPGTAASIF
jgi:hypothetical protein